MRLPSMFLSAIVTVIAAWSPLYAESEKTLPYQFKSILELDHDNCPAGQSCLLQSYLAVALFSHRKIDGRQIGVLMEDYFYCHDETGDVYRAPIGFRTDFLSIPELAQFSIRPKDFMDAAVIHDWLYAVGEKDKQEKADQIFHDMLIETEAGLVKRNVMYNAVRWFGKTAYGALQEIPIVDLAVMKEITPSPIQRPVNAIVANIDCSNPDKFEEIRRTYRSNTYYKSKRDSSFQHKGFVLEED